MKSVEVTNMTSLFSKDMLIYSFFDIRLKQPLRMIAIFYFIVLFFILGIPIIILFWPINIYGLAFAIGLPLGGSILMSKPIWSGKSFMSNAKTQINYLSRPKVLYDWKAQSKDEVYEVNSQILVSRHSDYNKLYSALIEEEPYV